MCSDFAGHSLGLNLLGQGEGSSMKGQAFHTSFVPLKRHKWDSTPAALSQSMKSKLFILHLCRWRVTNGTQRLRHQVKV